MECNEQLSPAMNRFVVISGLPASGKSTLARAVGPALGLPVLDKDDLLETLFEHRGVGAASWRRELSRSADAELQSCAELLPGAVLASWWKHPRSPDDSGTPIEWLTARLGSIVELHCVCSPATAARRFIARKRHPGHLDDRWSYPELLARFTQQASWGALRIGPVVDVPTESGFELGAVLRDLACATLAAC